MRKKDIRDLMTLIYELAYEQSTREYSGSGWFDQFAKRLAKLETSLLNSEQKDERSVASKADSSTDDGKTKT